MVNRKIARKFTGILLALIMLCSVTAPSFADNSKVADSVEADQHWAEPYILNLIDQGVINGYQDDTFKPDQPVTRAEFALIATNLFQFKKIGTQTFQDVSPSAWYSTSILEASGQGFLVGYDGNAYPDRNITREEAAVMISRIVDCKGDGDLSQFKDEKEVSSWARNGLSAVVKAGYMSGDDKGLLRPKDSMTRAEIAKIFTLASGRVYREPGTYDLGDVTGNVTIVCSDVVLKNGTVRGDLFVTSGADGGEITLNNVTVEGRTRVTDARINDVTPSPPKPSVVENKDTDQSALQGNVLESETRD